MCDLTVEEVAKLIDKAYEDEVNNYTELPEKLKNDRIKYTDSLLRQIRCEACQNIDEIELIDYEDSPTSTREFVSGWNGALNAIKEKR